VVQDLLEDLAHARAHQVALLGIKIVVAPAHPCRLARVDGLQRVIVFAPRLLLVHGPEVSRRASP
jgi:hypothetical protein